MTAARRIPHHALGLIALAIGLVTTGAQAQAPTIPDLDVSGPAPEFEMDSRLMTSGKRMAVWLTVPGKGKVKVMKFNGTFFYRDSKPEVTSGTLMFRADQFQDVEGKLAKELTKALDFGNHPFFAFQSRSASPTRNGVDLNGKLIVKDRETDVTLRMRSPGSVAINDSAERWIKFEADMEIDAADVGLSALGEKLRLDFDMFLFNYTIDSPKKTGINTAALDENPPKFPRDAESLSNAGWYLMYTRRYEEAIEAFDKSIATNPRSVNSFLRRGDAYVFDGQYGKAMGTYKVMSQFMPAHPHMLELMKVLNGDYLTPASLSAVNAQWRKSQ